MRRRMLSAIGNHLACRLLGYPLKDLTGGYNAWQTTALQPLLNQPFYSRGHAFQLELKHRALKNGADDVEIPITFIARAKGASKLSGRHIAEWLRLLIHLIWRNDASARTAPPKTK